MKAFEFVKDVTSPFSLAAFAIAALLVVALSRRKEKTPPILWGLVIAIVVIGLTPVIVPALAPGGGGMHHLRVTVLDTKGMPVEDARVWSSIGGEAKRVAGGWQFDIAKAARPADGRLTVFATVENAFLTGKQDVVLSDENQAASVQLARTGVNVRGMVMDSNGKAVAGARVSVVGHGSEAVTTGAAGDFVLPAHAADGQQVQLHVEWRGKAVTQYHPAGDFAATIQLNP
ncbi:MAG: hypothetical protein FJW40_11055 [Acidobacteria bacterium]|nr:hypothetical protein [Acidobacteriota bacterium]